MTTEELVEELKRHPGLKVCVLSGHYGDGLDDDPGVGVAVDHPGSYPDGRRDWHWEGAPVDVPGERVVVVY